jgi:signal transduction histidine kinase
MVSSDELLRTRERLLVGRRFLLLRPTIALAGAAGNALCLAASSAPSQQKLALGAALTTVVLAFFAEAWWLRTHALTARWLGTSLTLTLIALATGAALSGGIESPVVPLLFAPVVVGFAAFERSPASAGLFALAAGVLAVLAFLPLEGFDTPPAPWGARMLLVSAIASFALLAVGVVGLVDAHARVSARLDRMRTDVLVEAEQRAKSVEHLGAKVAHEIKNPLTAARSLVELVARKSAERDRERLGVVVREIDRALEVLGDYLAFARPLSELTLREVDLRAVLEDVAGVIEARAAERNVRVTVSGASTVTAGDRGRLRDAVLNLALNGIDAMPSGGPLSLAVARESDALVIEVADAGEGLSAAAIARLGEAFVSESAGGTGLGVLVARGIVAQHGGRLRFESELGRGTRAIIELEGRRS